MEFSADTRRDLLALFAEILDANATCSPLGTAQRVVGGCQRLRSVLASRDAEFTPVVERLLREAATVRSATDDDRDGSAGHDTSPDECSEADESDTRDAGESGGPGTAEDDVDTPDAVQPIPAPKESAQERSRRELRAKWMDHFDTFHAALAAGRVSPEHADQLARTSQALPAWIVAVLAADQPRLVLLAATYAAEGFGLMVGDWVREIRADHGISEFQHQLAESRASIWLDRNTGLYHVHAVFDPERGPVVQDALDQQTNRLRAGELGRRLTTRQIAAQALYELVTGASSVTPRAVVVVDHETAATAQAHDHTVCENIDGVPLPLDIAHDAVVNGKITAAILDRAGKPADLAHPEHQATIAQRDDLRAMYPRCAHPDCGVPFSRCEMHHITYWSRHGRTLVSNLLPLCLKHHHDIHDRAWRLTMDEHRTCRWYRPDGTLYATVHLTRLDHRDPDNLDHWERDAKTEPPAVDVRTAAAEGRRIAGGTCHAAPVPGSDTPGRATPPSNGTDTLTVADRSGSGASDRRRRPTPPGTDDGDRDGNTDDPPRLFGHHAA